MLAPHRISGLYCRYERITGTGNQINSDISVFDVGEFGAVEQLEEGCKPGWC